MGVKKKYRPEWLDQENRVFINKLNAIVKTYDTDHKTVSALLVLTLKTKNLKHAVYNLHRH